MITNEHPHGNPIYKDSDRRFIGFWRTQQYPNLPSPEDFIDEDWNDIEQELVASFLDSGRRAVVYRGEPTCCICGHHIAGCTNADLDDSFFVWPVDFAHYVRVHAVRPPQEFVDHVKAMITRRREVFHKSADPVPD